MLKLNELTLVATPEQLNTTIEEMTEWFHENLEPLDSSCSDHYLTGHLTGETEGFVAAYKASEKYRAEEWRIEKSYTDDRFTLVINLDLVKLNGAKVLCFDKEIIRNLWANTKTTMKENDGFTESTYVPKNPDFYCVGPDKWWKSDFELVSESTSLNSFVYLNIKPWLASNPGKTPLDYPSIELNGGKIVPSEYAEWFETRFPELMQNFRNAQEEIGLIETEIRHAERELKFLKEKRLKIFEGL